MSLLDNCGKDVVILVQELCKRLQLFLVKSVTL